MFGWLIISAVVSEGRECDDLEGNCVCMIYGGFKTI